jgi:hypothetical protein
MWPTAVFEGGVRPTVVDDDQGSFLMLTATAVTARCAHTCTMTWAWADLGCFCRWAWPVVAGFGPL